MLLSRTQKGEGIYLMPRSARRKYKVISKAKVPGAKNNKQQRMAGLFILGGIIVHSFRYPEHNIRKTDPIQGKFDFSFGINTYRLFESDFRVPFSSLARGSKSKKPLPQNTAVVMFYTEDWPTMVGRNFTPLGIPRGLTAWRPYLHQIFPADEGFETDLVMTSGDNQAAYYTLSVHKREGRNTNHKFMAVLDAEPGWDMDYQYQDHDIIISRINREMQHMKVTLPHGSSYGVGVISGDSIWLCRYDPKRERARRCNVPGRETYHLHIIIHKDIIQSWFRKVKFYWDQ
ncbi:uncharacterized protein BO97DRAFT_476892 [Aspergillus homomorphus CBS 101889]|uniref:Uncharacterized protein n=1 Tax=Aspergillus homomorphus (strain CBS 101889) TaxID=1450537 RepID=A0A395I1V1_ASPHC|nr:hypothetical protein BO97DRAFT_476892 [Aspergillus homomorphus CBS 101889]RAL14172.1 hypothetical protein BO97DRAFT_476892 [Aspergillus homomorphus CBS 101889]